MAHLAPHISALIERARVAHLATADASGAPHLVPVCFAYDGDHFYSVLDRKPKRTSLTSLKRVRNLVSNPVVALVVDHYEEEWSRLWYVLVTGSAYLITEGDEHRRAIGLLREKYAQYSHMDIDRSPVIKITPAKITSWGKVPIPDSPAAG